MFLGVDSGGTSTVLCLVSGHGDVLAQVQTASTYSATEGAELVTRVLRAGLDEISDRAGVAPADIAYAFFGLPGYGEVAAAVPALDAIPRALLGHDRYRCDNDMVCGWAGSLAATDGINVISGTGSMTYGRRAGTGVRVGGWGELFGDEGSAYWIAIRGLNAATRMSDGRLPVGPLLQTIRARLALSADLDLVDVVLHRWRADRGRIASLSRQVVDAADLGDACAAEIIRDAADELVLLVDATRRRLGYQPGEVVPVSYSGGTFSAPRLRQAFAEALPACSADFRLHAPLYPPAVGAALYGAALAGTPLSAAALDRLREAAGLSTSERSLV